MLIILSFILEVSGPQIQVPLFVEKKREYGTWAEQLLRTHALQRRSAREEPHELHAWFGKSPAQTLNKKNALESSTRERTRKKVVSDETEKKRWQGASGFAA